MYVGTGNLYDEWQSLLINDEMVLAAEFAAVGGIAAGKRAAVGRDGTLAESTLARSQWIWSYSRIRCSMA